MIPPHLNTTLAGRYVLERELGAGGMATVYLAKDLKHDRYVAVKVLRADLPTPSDVQRFLREIRVAARLSHPGILALHDSGELEGVPYYVMPYVEGPTLRGFLESRGPLPVDEAARLTCEIAEALHYAHDQGVVHRDIKPANILCSQGRLLIADFGIAKAVASSGTEHATATGSMLGTPLYMSPEQARGDRDVDRRADIYALGCVAFELIAGKPPFEGPSPPAILFKHVGADRPSIRALGRSAPAAIDDAIQKAMAIDPADRFATAAEFARAMVTAAGGSPEGQEPSEGKARVSTARVLFGSRWRKASVAASIVLAAVLVITLRDRDGSKTDTVSGGLPAPTAWVDVSGEHFDVVAEADSFLLLHRFRGPAVNLYGPQGWQRWIIPDSFELSPYRGKMPGGKLLASRRRVGEDGTLQTQLWWLESSREGLRPLMPLSEFERNAGQPSWWSDGTSVVTWLDSIQKFASNRWTREPSGSATPVRSMWGASENRRFALVDAPRDSVLIHDGISWQRKDPLPDRSSDTPTYQGGATLPDGSTIIFGGTCGADSLCAPLILAQAAGDAKWVRVSLPRAPGVLSLQHRVGDGSCPSRYSILGAAGQSHENYYVWGLWSWCAAPSMKRETAGCPPGYPCVWQVSRGVLRPVESLRGRSLASMFRIARSDFALANDGALLRRVDDAWRVVEHVPGLPTRRVAASPRVVAMFSGHRVTYQPGSSDTTANFFLAPLPGLPASISAEHPPARLVVKDSLIALLSETRSAFTAPCAAVVRSTGTGAAQLRCRALIPVPPSPEPVNDIGILPNGDLIGVGRGGLVWVWRDGSASRERVPAEVRGDSLWGVHVARDGVAWAIGTRFIIRRDSVGNWQVARRLAPGAAEGTRFIVFPNGEMAVVGSWIRVWTAGADSAPAAILHRPATGEARVGAVHPLPDGRLVVGYSVPDSPGVGGWLQVWELPVSRNRSQRIDLPTAVDVTDLADDGRYLYVVGRGGTMSIPIDSLPRNASVAAPVPANLPPR